jgi:hypothetical protein
MEQRQQQAEEEVVVAVEEGIVHYTGKALHTEVRAESWTSLPQFPERRETAITARPSYLLAFPSESSERPKKKTFLGPQNKKVEALYDMFAS